VFGDAESMPLNSASFDVVYSFGVLHHTPNIEASIAEVHRVLRPGGSATIGLYHRNSYFFWVQTILGSGILNLGLLRGFRRHMSDIEFRDDPDSAIPLVNVYSRRQVRKLFSAFDQVKIETCHVEPSHFYRLARLMRGLGRTRLERWFGRGGWYVVARAVK
jgi:SAM-dependent methyltransferase